MAKNELSRLRGLLLADVKAREQILDILNKLEEMDLNNTGYIEEISTKLLALNKFSTKEEYEATNNELNNLLLQINELSEINNLIPDTATPENKLVDKNFLNSSISTATAEFRGTVENLETLNSLSADKNDYAFYKHTDESGNTVFDRYKFTDKWEYEYTLNNSSFTAEQWATINSGLTANVLNDLVADTERKLEKKVNYTDIVDALNSEETSKPLSAKMGKELKTQVDTKAELQYVNEELNKKASNNQVDEKISGVKGYVDETLTNYPTNTQVDATLENYAKKDGYYETFGYAREAGVAKNLKSDKDRLLDPDVTTSGGTVYADQPFTQRATAMTMKAYLDNELITVGSGYEQWRKEQAFSIVRNNQAPHTNGGTHGTTIAYDPSTRIFTVSGTSTIDYTNLSDFSTRLYGHKILMVFQLISNPNNVSKIEYCYFNQTTKRIITNGVIGTYGVIISPSSSMGRAQGITGFSAGTDLTGIQFRIIQIDLTQWFASRPEIATALNGDAGVKWFLQNYPEALTLGYDEGTIVDTEDYDYETTGVNLWDEEWENKTINDDTGEKRNDNRICSKNFIPCFPNTTYYALDPLNNDNFRFFFYDENYDYISHSIWTGNKQFTTPLNAKYMQFIVAGAYGTTYNNDIQICQHFTETSVEQTYHKYEIFKDRVSWAFTSTGKGKSAGSVADTKDYVNKKNIEKVGQVDLGTLNWDVFESDGNLLFTSVVTNKSSKGLMLCSKYSFEGYDYDGTIASSPKDKTIWGYILNSNAIRVKDSSFTNATDFKNAMSGVILNYELATYNETDMSGDELDTNIPENDYGVERKVPVSGNMFSGSATTILYQDIVWKQIYNNKSLIDNLRADVNTLESRIPDAGENTVSTHNTSSTAHSDIRTLVSNAQTAADNAQTKANEIEDLIVKNGVIDGSPRGVYANLSALQTAYPSGASGVYITSDNGHWHYWNGSAWTDGGVYQSSEDIEKINAKIVDNAFTKPIDVILTTDDLNNYDQNQQLLRCAVGVKNAPNASYNHFVIVYSAFWQSKSRYTTIQVAYELSTRMLVSFRYKESSSTTWSSWKTIDIDNITNGNLLQNSIIGREKLKDFYQSSVSDIVESGTDINTFNKANAFFSNIGALNNPNNKDPFFIFSFVMPWQGASRYTLVELAFNRNDLSDIYIREYDSKTDTWRNWKNNFTNNYGKGKTVVMMGDSTYNITGTTNKRINDYVEKYLRCTVINCGMGGTRMSDSRGSTSADSYKPFDFPNLIDAKQANDFSAQEQKLSDKATSFVEAFNLFKNVDFSKVDVLCIEYGANDFYATNNVGVPLGDFTKNRATYTGGMIYCVEKLLSAYPNLTIFVDGIRYRYFLDTNDDAFTHKNNLNLTSRDYIDAEIKVAKMYGLPYADNLDGYGWNKYNRSIYFPSTDGAHFNEKGTKFAGKILAEHLGKLGCMTE